MADHSSNIIKSLQGLLRVLPKHYRQRFYRLLVLMSLSALMEMVTLSGLFPFLAFLLQGQAAMDQDWGRWLSRLMGGHDASQVALSLGMIYLAWIILAFSLGMLVTFRRTAFIRDLKTHVTCDLFDRYLHQPFAWHSAGNSAKQTSMIAEAVGRGIDTALNSFLIIVSNSLVACALVLALTLMKPLITSGALLSLAGFFIFLHLLRNRFLQADGQLMTAISGEKYQLMNEAFGGIKELKVYQLEGSFAGRMQPLQARLAQLERRPHIAGFLPRQIIEFLIIVIAVGTSITLLLQGGDVSRHLPLLAIGAVAFMRIFPPLNLVFLNYQTLRDNHRLWHRLQQDLSLPREGRTPEALIQVESEIRLERISFSYPQTNSTVLNEVSLAIPAGGRIGLVGPTGSGKSTLVNLILGLLQPDSGKIYVDGRELDAAMRAAWTHSIGYVPQEMHLLDAPIWVNIAFGKNRDTVDMNKVKESAAMAEISTFIESLPSGYDTRVGERGIRLSGGQRQRLSIARALYRNPSLLVLDEATSALDSATEAAVMESITRLPQTLTIIMIAHRVSTLKNASTVYALESGRIIKNDVQVT